MSESIAPRIITHAKAPTPSLFSDLKDPAPASDVAERLGLSSKTIIRHIKDGSLPGFRLGRHYFCTRAGLMEFIQSGGDL